MKHCLIYHPLTIIAALLFLGIWPPTLSRPARLQAPQSGISTPVTGETVSGIVVVQGTAVDPAFLRYELAFNNGGDWIVFAEGDQPVVEGTLAVWDTTVGWPTAPVFPDGVYLQLRLRVVRVDYNYDEYYVRDLQVANDATPTPSPTATLAGGTATPVDERVVTPATPRPELLPSLTPFPTPSPVATVAVILPSEGGGGLGVEEEGGNRGLLQRLLALDTARLSTAFWQGARLALLPFAVMAIYLAVRRGVRRLWRTAWGRRQKRDEQQIR